MKVGLVCPYSFDVPGGVGAHVRDLAEELLRLGHDVSVLAPAEDETDLPPYVVPTGRSVPVPYNGSVARLSFGLGSAMKVRRWIRENDFDVLHVHEPLNPSLGMLACWAALGPVVATFHASMDRSRLYIAGYGIAQQLLEKIRARIAVSERARITLVNHLGGDAVLIPNGVAVRRYREADPLPGWPVPEGSLGFLGRMDEPRKGLPLLLEAFPGVVSARPGTRLLVAGPGDPDVVWDGLPADLHPLVTVLGRVDEQTKVAMLASPTVYVAPNTGGESFGIVLLEAMAAGTPVLASDIEAFRDVLEGGEAGALFRSEDPADLATQAVALLDDPQRRAALAAEAATVVDRYDWTEVARQVVAVYETVAWSGERVQEDSRGQGLGLYTRVRDDS